MAEKNIYRVVNGVRYSFPDEEKARLFDSAYTSLLQKYAEEESIASQIVPALKSIVPGMIRGTAMMSTGIGSLFQSEGAKQFGETLSRGADIISDKMMKPYQRYTTLGSLGETAGAMAPAAIATAASLALAPEAALAAGIAGGAVGGLQSAGEIGQDIAEARARGAQITPEAEQRLAATYGGLSALLEGSSMGSIARGAKSLALGRKLASEFGEEAVKRQASKELADLLAAGSKDMLLRAGKSALQEGATEGAQQVLLNTMAREYDPNRDITQGVGESVFAGAALGGVLGGGIDLYKKKKLEGILDRERERRKEGPAVPQSLEDALVSTEIEGQQREELVAGILSEQRAKTLDDALTSAISTLVDPEQLQQKISSDLFGSEYNLLDKKQSRKVDEKLKKELPSPFQRMRAYQEIAARDQFGKLYSELSDAKADESDKSELDIANEFARDLFQRRVDPNSIAIGIQVKEREAPGAVETKPQPPIEAGPVFAGDLPESEIARLQEEEQRERVAQAEAILERPIKAPTSRAYIDAEGRVVEPGPVLYQKIQRQKYVPEPVIEGSLEAEKAKGLPGGRLSEEGVFVPDNSLEYEAEAQQRIDDRLQPESILGQVVQATDQQIGQRQESLKQAYEPAPPPSMEQIVEATAEMPRQIEIEEAQAAEDRQFSRYKKFDRDEYRSVLEGLKSTPDAAISSSYLAKNFGLTPPAANSMMSLMRSRGDIKESDGKLFVNPEAEGPMYKLRKRRGTPPAAAAVATTPAQPERGTPIPTVPRLNLDVEAARKVSSGAYQQLRKLNVSDLYSLVVVDNFLTDKGEVDPAGASFLNNVIKLASKENNIAESEENLINTVNHEVVHGMRKSGFFSDPEWNLLTAKFTPQGELDQETIAAYQSRFKNETPERLNEILKEEAVAHAIERLGKEPAKPLSLPEKTLMQKVKDLARIGTSANSLGYTAEDLISAVRAGDVGRRAIPGERTTLQSIKERAKRGDLEAPSRVDVSESESIPEEPEPVGLREAERRAARESRVAPGYESEEVVEGESPTELRGKASGDDAMFSFVGTKAYSRDPVESARMASFKESALQMEAEGLDPDDIRLATGWFRNPYDKMWRYEVADENARMTQKFKDLPEGKSIPLLEALDHPELFTAYPDLIGIKVSKERDRWDFWRSTQGWFNPKTNTLNITPYSKDPESTLLHEVQHWIQEHEGFATGGNLEIAKEKATPGQIQAIVRAEVEEKNKELEKTAKKIEELRKSRDFLSAHSSEMAPLIDVERQVGAAWDEVYEHAKKSGEGVSDPKTEEGKRLKERWKDLNNIKNNMINSAANSIASKSGDSSYALIRPIIDAMSFKAQELADRENDFVKTQKEIAGLSSGNQEAISKLVERKAFKLYQNIAGEIESRDVQARKEYTPEKRRETKPLTSENIPPSEALIIKGTPSSEISKETSEPPEERAMFKLIPQAKPELFEVSKNESVLDMIANGFRTNSWKSAAADVMDYALESKAGKAIIGPKSGMGKTISVRQRLFAGDVGILKNGEMLHHETGDSMFTDATSSAIAASRQAQKQNELLSQALEEGYIVIDKDTGWWTVVKSKDHAIMPQIRNLAEKGKLYLGFEAGIARRKVEAQKVTGNADKILGGDFTLQDAIRIDNKYKGDQDVQRFLEVYKNFNNSLVYMNKQAGNFDQDTVNRLVAWYYSSYYRMPVDKDGQIVAPTVSSAKIANLKGLTAIKGSKERINDALENFITNAQFMVGYAMNNHAAQRVVRDLVYASGIQKPGTETAIATEVSSPDKATNPDQVIRINVNGKPKYYEIPDPVMYNSIMRTRTKISGLSTVSKGFTSVFRAGITTSINYVVGNLRFDSLRLWFYGIYDGLPIYSIPKNLIQGATSVLTKDKYYTELLNAGLIANPYSARDAVRAANKIRASLQVDQNNAIQAALSKYWDLTVGKVQDLSAASEAVNRVQVYKNVYKKMLKAGQTEGGARAAALFASMEYPVNFDVHGDGAVAQYASSYLPFVTSQITGLDVFARQMRALYHSTTGKRKPATKLQEMMVNGMKRTITESMIFGFIYTFMMATADDDSWRKATPEERYKTVFIPLPGAPMRIPIPEEIGAISLLIPSILASQLISEGKTGMETAKSVVNFLTGIFTFDPTPQFIKPTLEVATNKNFYTWRSIEDESMRKLMPEYRYDERTSLLGKALGEYASKAALPVSPVQFDHLIRGYFGTLGVFTSDVISYLFDVTKEKEPERWRLEDPYLLPGIGRLFVSPQNRNAVEDYYAIRNAAVLASNSIKGVAAGRLYEEDPEKLRQLAILDQINKAMDAGPEKEMQKLRKLKREVLAASPDQISPSRKRDILKQIDLRINDIAKGVQPLKQYVPFTWF